MSCRLIPRARLRRSCTSWLACGLTSRARAPDLRRLRRARACADGTTTLCGRTIPRLCCGRSASSVEPDEGLQDDGVWEHCRTRRLGGGASLRCRLGHSCPRATVMSELCNRSKGGTYAPAWQCQSRAPQLRSTPSLRTTPLSIQYFRSSSVATYRVSVIIDALNMASPAKQQHGTALRDA